MLPLRLLVATAAVSGLAIAGLSPAPAHAAVPITDGTLALDADLNFNSSSCTGASAPAGVSAPFTAGTTVKRTLTFDQTATASDPTDSVRMRGSQTTAVSSTAAGGQVTSLTVTSTITGSVTPTKATSACDQGSDFPTGESSQSQVQAVLHRSTAGWLHVQATSTGVGGHIVAVGVGDDRFLQSEIGGFAIRDISHDSWVYVPAGDSEVQVQLGGASVDNFGLAKISLKQSVTLTFLPAGVARTATTGTARSKVVFPNVLTCSTGKAVARLTSKVRGASRVTFYVNGVKKQSYVRPGARTVVLTGVPKNRAVALKAIVKDGRRTLTAARAYRSC